MRRPSAIAGPGGAAVDVYALGVLAFRMLVGRLPFGVDGSVSMMAVHLNGRAPSRVPRQIMAKSPAERLGPVEAIDALRQALEAPARRRWPRVVGPLLVLLALVAAGLSLPDGGQSEDGRPAGRCAERDGDVGRAPSRVPPPPERLTIPK